MTCVWPTHQVAYVEAMSQELSDRKLLKHISNHKTKNKKNNNSVIICV